MNTHDEINSLVSEFAECVIQQTDLIAKGDPDAGNVYAQRRAEIFAKLRELGETGRDGLLQLFGHDRADVRVMAASYLLRHRNREATDLLRIESRQRGLAGFSASQALQRWADGDWQLDPQ